MGIGPDLKDAAVLGIDLQNEYRHDGVFPVAGYDDLLARAADVLGAARAQRMPVFHAQAWMAGSLGEGPLVLRHTPQDLRTAVPGSAGAEICAEVAPRDGETVLRKRFPSAFQATGLEERLQDLRAKQIVVMGVWTDSCVRATVLDAVSLGFAVWLVKDACGSGTETMHRAAVLDMANRLYSGGVLHAAEAVKALQAKPSQAWRCTRPVEFHYTCDTIDPLYESL